MKQFLDNQASSGIVSTKMDKIFVNTSKIAIRVISLTFTNTTENDIGLELFQCLDNDKSGCTIRNIVVEGFDTVVVADGEKLLKKGGFFSAKASQKGIDWNCNYRILDPVQAHTTAVQNVINITNSVESISGTNFRITNNKLQVKIDSTGLWYSLIGVMVDGIAVLTLNQNGEA